MIVRELMGLLSKAAPHATVMLLNDYKERNAQPIKSLEVCGLEWTIETGLSNGSPYERYYAGEPLPELRTNLEQVRRKRVAVLLLVA
jgi:hypothetical protein